MTAAITLWHNPRCSKSREALKLLQQAGADVTEYRYLDEAPSRAQIETLLGQLDLTPGALLRKGEALAKELGLTPTTDPDLILDAMAANPKLIERPIAITGKRAVIGRPPEDVLTLL